MPNVVHWWIERVNAMSELLKSERLLRVRASTAFVLDLFLQLASASLEGARLSTMSAQLPAMPLNAQAFNCQRFGVAKPTNAKMFREIKENESV
jgi:hypothetical protein